MKARDPKSLEGLLQKKLAEHEASPPPQLWSKIERDTAPPKLRFLARRLNTHLHWLNLAATALLVMVALFFWYQPQNDALQIPIPKLHKPLKNQIQALPDSLDSLKNLFQSSKRK